MNTADTLRGLLRRWYIVVPGILLAVASAIGAFAVVHPGYQRTATQVLLPGAGTVPAGATNPFLFLGGLTQAADIVVQVMRSDQVLGEVTAEYPGTTVAVQRDPTTSGPVIQIVVTARSDAAAAGALSAAVDQSAAVLDRLQTEQHVDANDRMTVSTLTQDSTSTLQQKTRTLASAGAGLAVLILTLVVASLVDGLSRRRRRSGTPWARRKAEVAEPARLFDPVPLEEAAALEEPAALDRGPHDPAGDAAVDEDLEGIDDSPDATRLTRPATQSRVP
jgi:capsular polysaccharide biosynthesis protein